MTDDTDRRPARGALAAYRSLVDLAPEARRHALDALSEPLRGTVAKMLDAEDASDLPDASDVWIGLRRIQPPHIPTIDPPPARIGGFEVVREIGRGAHGVVYEATQAVPRRNIAVKLLYPLPPATRRQVLDEAERLAKLEHPAFPYVVNAGEDAGRAYIAMQLIDGAPFDRWAREVAPADRLAAVLELCEAMTFAHSQGIVHRDLKPSNLLVGVDGRVRVIDLGLAAGTSDGVVSTAGTLAYMAPEGTPSVEADVYAIGVLTWQALTDALPYDVRGLGLRRAALVKHGPLPQMPPLAGLRTHELVNALTAALDPDPSRRTPSVAALAHGLRAALRPTPPLISSKGRIAAAIAVLTVVAALRARPGAAVELDAAERAAELHAQQGRDQAALSTLRAATALAGPRDDIARAWARQAERTSDPTLRRVAGVESFLAADSQAAVESAARALGSDLSAHGDWAGLSTLAVVARGAGHPLDEVERSVRIATRSWSPADPFLGALATGVGLPARAARAHAEAGEVWLIGDELARVDLQTLETSRVVAPPGFQPDAGAWFLEDQGARYLIGHDEHTGRLWRWEAGWGAATQLPGRVLDVVRGETAPHTVWLAFGEMERAVRALNPATGALSPTTLPGLLSDVQDIQRVGDTQTDHEGQPAHITLHGPWEAYLALASDLQGRPLWHYPLSGSSRLARIDGGVAVVTGPRYAPPESRGASSPAGLHVLNFTATDPGGALALPSPAEGRWAVRDLFAGDLDGDGDGDLLASLLLGERAATWAIERTDSGWAGWLIDQALPLALVQADDDRAMEVVLRLVDRGDEVWLLGRGDQPLAATAPSASASASTPRADLLGAVGAWGPLVDEAVAGGIASDFALGVRELRATGQPELALAAMERAPPALLRAAELGDALVEMLWFAGRSEDAAQRAVELGRAAPSPDLNTLVPPDAWRPTRPAQVRVEGSTLQLVGPGGSQPLAELDLAPSARVEVRMVVDLTRVEPGARLAIALRRGDQDVSIASIIGWGGRGLIQRELGCEGPGFPPQVALSTAHRPNDTQRLHIVLKASEAESGCELGTVGRTSRSERGERPPPDGAWQVQVRNLAHPTVSAPQLHLALREVVVIGASAIAAEDLAHAAWTHGQLRAARDALPSGFERELLDVDLGHDVPGEHLLAAPNEELARQLRRYPQAWLPWLSERLDPARLKPIYALAWDGTMPTTTDGEIESAMLSPIPDRFALGDADTCAFAWQRGRWLFGHEHFDRAADQLVQMRDGCPEEWASLETGLLLVRALRAAGRTAEARDACAEVARTVTFPALYTIDLERFGLADICPAPSAPDASSAP